MRRNKRVKEIILPFPEEIEIAEPEKDIPLGIPVELPERKSEEIELPGKINNEPLRTSTKP